jgi:alkaline phosphatase
VIGGAGSPDYDDNGNLRTTPLYNWISEATWTDLVNGTNVSGNNSYNFNLVRDRADIQAIANGTTPAPEKLAMILKTYTSTQFNRAGDTTNPLDPHTKEPFTDPLRTDVPTQAELTIAALNAVGRQISPRGKARGFYLMTEAGAVDRAEHANNTGRMIEEHIASNDTIKAIIDWVNRADTDASWDNTLLIVSADHDHLLYGPDGATVPFQKLQDNGPGKTPGNKWFGPNHGTGLVPLYAYGAGSQELTALATKVDTYLGPDGKRRGHGNYLDQTDVGTFLKSVLSKAE